MPHAHAPVFVPDSELDYAKAFRAPARGEALTFDTIYRYAHLPLVAPAHPDVIAEHAERGYAMGRHRNIRSLVVPVPWAELAASPDFQALMAEMHSGPLANVIAWPAMEQRKNRLHATICGDLPMDEEGGLSPAMRQHLRGIGPIHAELRGMFSGNMNIGRLYLCLYPEQRDGQNVIHTIQAICGRPPTRLYVMGLFNLTDNLSPDQAAWLAASLARWQHRAILRLELPELWLIDARDDLVLDGEIVERVPLQSQ